MTFTEQYIIPILKSIKDPRLFNSERGYQGQLIALLHQFIETEDIFPDGTIVEQEYQKTIKHHGIRQRPDIILHIPIERGITTDRTLYNYYVLALKLNGKQRDASDDFDKLDDMFSQLNYPEGVFINIGAYPSVFLTEYRGPFPSRIHELSVSLNEGSVCLCHAKFEDGKIVTRAEE